MSQSYEELLSQVRGGRQVTADSRKAYRRSAITVSRS